MIWILADFDWKAVSSSPPGLGTFNGKNKDDSTARDPVHGSSRNYVFFDGHVDKKKVTKPEDY